MLEGISGWVCCHHTVTSQKADFLEFLFKRTLSGASKRTNRWTSLISWQFVDRLETQINI